VKSKKSNLNMEFEVVNIRVGGVAGSGNGNMRIGLLMK